MASQHAMFTPFIREGMDNQKAWEKKFYEEAEAWRNSQRGRIHGLLFPAIVISSLPACLIPLKKPIPPRPK
jgi:hypothetical protein